MRKQGRALFRTFPPGCCCPGRGLSLSRRYDKQKPEADVKGQVSHQEPKSLPKRLKASCRNKICVVPGQKRDRSQGGEDRKHRPKRCKPSEYHQHKARKDRKNRPGNLLTHEVKKVLEKGLLNVPLGLPGDYPLGDLRHIIHDHHTEQDLRQKIGKQGGNTRKEDGQ